MTDVRVEPARAGDRAAILRLLNRVHLPKDGLSDDLPHAVVARRDDDVIGSAVLEIYEGGALLRSVAVDPSVRGVGLGERLTTAAIARARELHVPALYLLTTTAERFFPRFGFTAITREDVPVGVRDSVEFRAACPASAIVMKKTL